MQSTHHMMTSTTLHHTRLYLAKDVVTRFPTYTLTRYHTHARHKHSHKRQGPQGSAHNAYRLTQTACASQQHARAFKLQHEYTRGHRTVALQQLDKQLRDRRRTSKTFAGRLRWVCTDICVCSNMQLCGRINCTNHERQISRKATKSVVHVVDRR